MIQLRNFKEQDAEFMLEWMHDYKIARAFKKNMEQNTLEDVKKYIASKQNSDKLKFAKELNYAVVDSDEDEYLGTVSLKNIDFENSNAEFAIVLREKAQGGVKGISMSATKLILDIAFRDLDLERVYLTVLHNNVRARNFYEKVGFIYEGTARKQLYIKDVFVNWDWYGLLKEDYYGRNNFIKKGKYMHNLNKVKMLEFPEHGDDRGHLVIVEGDTDVPFKIERVFYIYGSDKDVVRGQHANKRTQFVLINVAGTSKVKVKDEEGNEVIYSLNRPHMGIYLPAMVWKDMYDFSEDSVLLVIASEKYDPSEYIRDYDSFVTCVNELNRQ